MIYRKKINETSIKEFEYSSIIKCDICGVETKEDWDDVYVEVSIEYNLDPIKNESFDICPKCFISKLCVWIEESKEY